MCINKNDKNKQLINDNKMTEALKTTNASVKDNKQKREYNQTGNKRSHYILGESSLIYNRIIDI